MAEVQLIAATRFIPGVTGVQPWNPEESASDGATLVEFAGRACYQSWTRPNPATRRVADYALSILWKRHFSVLEHPTATFYVTGIDRDTTHELIRHRHLSYSELSQRYVQPGTGDYGAHIVPPALRETSEETQSILAEGVQDALVRYKELLFSLRIKGKRGREAARRVLPGAMETRIVVTGNYRAWRQFVVRRGSEAADASIREVAMAVLDHLQKLSPEVFGDLRVGTTVGGGRYVIPNRFTQE